MKYLKKYEAAESVEFEDNWLEVYDDDTLPFEWEIDNASNIQYGSPGSYHSENRNIRDGFNECESIRGRLWMDSKVMGFWSEVEKDDFTELILVLQQELDIKIFNNGWRYDAYDGLESVDDFDPNKTYVDVEQLLLHNMSPTEKEEYYKANPDKRKEQPKGLGSRYYDEKLPKNTTTAEYKDKISKYKYTEGNIMSFESYNIQVMADTSTMNNVPVVDYVDLDYFGTDVEMDEKEPPNKTGRDDMETKNSLEKAPQKISPA